MGFLNGIFLGLWVVMFIIDIVIKRDKIYIANDGMWILNFTYFGIGSYLMAPINIISEIIIAIYCSILVFLWSREAAATDGKKDNYSYFYVVITVILAISHISSIIKNLVN